MPRTGPQHRAQSAPDGSPTAGRQLRLVGFWTPRKRAINVAVWGMIAILVATQVYFRSLPYPPSWARLIGVQLAYWLTWAVLTPLIFLLADRLPLEAGRRGRNLALQVVAGTLLSILLTAYFALLMREFGPDAASGPFAVEKRYSTVFLKYFTLGFHYDFLIYWAVLGAAWSISYSRRAADFSLRAAQLDARLVEAQLQALRLQIQPHFLFNTLHAVSSLMDEDVPRARRMLARLADLLRMTLERREDASHSLREEMEIVSSYLAIERERLGERLTIRVELEEAALDMRLPVLLLQPLIENAVRHGIASRSEGGSLDIRAIRTDEGLRISVEDDGPGLDSTASADRGGLGLRNVRERLEQTYGPMARLDVSDREGGGVRATVEIDPDDGSAGGVR